MTKVKFLDFEVLKETISQENVLAMAETIAFYETKYLVGYMGYKVQKMHNELYGDIKNKGNVKYVLSNSYDLVQEGALYLCQHYGEHLSDVVEIKKGKKITVKIACIRKMEKLISLKVRDYSRHIAFDDLTPANEPRTEMELKQEQDYTKYDRIVESLNLTENMKVALECRIKGLSYPEISRILERAQSTVFEYFVKMRQRYVAIFG